MTQPVKTSDPLPDDWSPVGLWEAAGVDTSIQRGIDEWKAGDVGGVHDECLPIDDAVALTDVVAALDGEKTLSKAARRRILEALEIDDVPRPNGYTEC
jgi:hypothetical protein